MVSITNRSEKKIIFRVIIEIMIYRLRIEITLTWKHWAAHWPPAGALLIRSLAQPGEREAGTAGVTEDQRGVPQEPPVERLSIRPRTENIIYIIDLEPLHGMGKVFL